MPCYTSRTSVPTDGPGDAGALMASTVTRSSSGGGDRRTGSGRRHAARAQPHRIRRSRRPRRAVHPAHSGVPARAIPLAQARTDGSGSLPKPISIMSSTRRSPRSISGTARLSGSAATCVSLIKRRSQDSPWRSLMSCTAWVSAPRWLGPRACCSRKERDASIRLAHRSGGADTAGRA
jgi:hypothetical protein